MTEHLPECLVPDFEAGRWICICKQLRACEERAVLHAELRWKADEEEVQQVTFQDGYKQGQRNVFARHDDWIVTGVCEQDCPGCRRLTELITERERGYAEGLDAAREAVEAAGHKRFGVYYECECPDEVREQDGHVIELQDFYGCENSLLYFVCRYCCSENDYHSERCSSGHDHGPDKPYCTAVAAIDELREKQ